MKRSLLWILTDIVSPALQQVLPDDAITRVQLAHCPTPYTGPDAVRLEVNVAGEDFGYVVFDPETFISTEDARDRLTSELADFVAESQFGWGQKRD